jgi:ABC-type transport system involved in cytochrome c biogenesis ATPase subunit
MLAAEQIQIHARGELVLEVKEIRIESGSAALLIGDNNSGKSLLLQAINKGYPFEGMVDIHTSTPLLDKLYRKRPEVILLHHTSHVMELDTIWKNLTLPLEKITNKQQTKLEELCALAQLPAPRSTRANTLSLSQLKMVELIRAVIQLPTLLLIDDVDTFFDEKQALVFHQIIDFSLRSGGSILATAKQRIDGFWRYYRIQNHQVVQL